MGPEKSRAKPFFPWLSVDSWKLTDSQLSKMWGHPAYWDYMAIWLENKATLFSYLTEYQIGRFLHLDFTLSVQDKLNVDI